MAIGNSFVAIDRRKNSIRIRFVAIAAAILVPGLLLGGWSVLASARAQVGQLQRRAADEARDIAEMLDRELTNAINILTALSTSQFLQSDFLKSFHDQASEVARRLNIRIGLRDPATGRQLLNTAMPWEASFSGAQAPGRAWLEEEVAKTGRASISNVFYIEHLKQFTVAVGLPVRQNGAHMYTLAVGIPAESYARALERRQLPPGWIVSVVGLDDLVVARSAAHDRFVGKKEATYAGFHEPTDAHGRRNTNGQGAGDFRSVHESKVARWQVVVTVSGEVVDLPVKDALAKYVATGGIFLIVVLGLSFFAGGRIAQAMGTLGIDRQPTRDELSLHERLAGAIADREQMHRRLMQAQEDERLRLARDLHDQTGQSLAAAMFDLKAMEPLIVESGRGHLRAVQAQFENIGQALHRVAWELRPAAIDALGVASALASYVEEWSAQFAIEADFHCRDPQLDTIPLEIKTTLYRLVQEGLTNIAKHAPGASSVSVVIDRSGGNLQLTIEDNGRGFDPTTQRAGSRNAGLGIAGMRERLALLGGSLEIESMTGGGTTIYARIPIEAERLIA